MYHKMFQQFMNLTAPEGDGTGGGGGKEDSLEQDLSDLGDTPPDDDDSGDDDDDKDDDKSDDDDESDDKSGDESDEDDDEKKDDEDEEEDEKDDEEEDKDDKATRPDASFKDIKTKYPNLFKEFPQLKSAFFLTPKFLEIFADPESAQDAAVRATMLDELESTFVGKADSKPLFETVHKNNPAAFKKIITGLGDTVRSIDQDSYIALSTPIIEELVYYASKHGERTNDKNLRLAARHIANFFFGNGGDIPDVSARVTGKKNEPSEAEVTLEREREEHRKEKFTGAFEKVAETTSKDLSRIIDNKLDKLTSFERKTVIKETRAEVDSTIAADRGFQATLKNLWSRAEKSGYSDESISRIKRAYLERARTIAPGIRNRLRKEAVEARTPNNGKREEKGEKRQFDRNSSNTHGRSSRVLDPKKIDWKQTSDIDILG